MWKDLVYIRSWEQYIGSKNVLFVPGIRRNLISVPALTKNASEVWFYDNKFVIEKRQ